MLPGVKVDEEHGDLPELREPASLVAMVNLKSEPEQREKEDGGLQMNINFCPIRYMTDRSAITILIKDWYQS